MWRDPLALAARCGAWPEDHAGTPVVHPWLNSPTPTHCSPYTLPTPPCSPRPGGDGGQVPKRGLWALPPGLLRRAALPAGGALRHAAADHGEALLPQVRGRLLPTQVCAGQVCVGRGGGANRVAGGGASIARFSCPTSYVRPPISISLWTAVVFSCAPAAASTTATTFHVCCFAPWLALPLPGRSKYHGNLDGAYFGTTLPHLFLLTYPSMRPPKPAENYVPKASGRGGGR